MDASASSLKQAVGEELHSGSIVFPGWVARLERFGQVMAFLVIFSGPLQLLNPWLLMFPSLLVSYFLAVHRSGEWKSLSGWFDPLKSPVTMVCPVKHSQFGLDQDQKAVVGWHAYGVVRILVCGIVGWTLMTRIVTGSSCILQEEYSCPNEEGGCEAKPLAGGTCSSFDRRLLDLENSDCNTGPAVPKYFNAKYICQREYNECVDHGKWYAYCTGTFSTERLASTLGLTENGAGSRLYFTLGFLACLWVVGAVWALLSGVTSLIYHTCAWNVPFNDAACIAIRKAAVGARSKVKVSPTMWLFTVVFHVDIVLDILALVSFFSVGHLFFGIAQLVILIVSFALTICQGGPHRVLMEAITSQQQGYITDNFWKLKRSEAQFEAVASLCLQMYGWWYVIDSATGFVIIPMSIFFSTFSLCDYIYLDYDCRIFEGEDDDEDDETTSESGTE